MFISRATYDDLRLDRAELQATVTTLTQTNAVLNADANDKFVCRMGFRFPAAAPGYVVNYIEVGRAQ